MIRRHAWLFILLGLLNVWGLLAPDAAAHPQEDLEPPPRELRLPVLMYHDIGATPARYRVTLTALRQQLDWLQEHGYTAVTLRDVHAYMFEGAKLPDLPVVLTFDDGRSSQWRVVAELNRRNMRGVFFVMGGAVGLTDEQLRQMVGWGHEVEAHSMTHPFLTQVSDARLIREVAGAKQALESKLGTPIRYFAYPYGDHDDRVIAAVVAAGYEGGIAAWGSSDWTPAKRWNEPRLEISGLLSLEGFARLVRSRRMTPSAAYRGPGIGGAMRAGLSA